MTPSGNGESFHYTVDMSGLVKEHLKSLHRQMMLIGKGNDVVNAYRYIIKRLRKDPSVFGDPLFRLPVLHLLVYQAVSPPLIVTYGVYDEKRLVFIRGFRLLEPAGS